MGVDGKPLTGLVLDRMRGVEGSRIVSVSSIGHRILSSIDFDDLMFEKGYNRVAAYGRSKLANLLFTYGPGAYGLAWRLILMGFVTVTIADLFFSYADWNGLYYPDSQANLLSTVAVDMLYIYLNPQIRVR